MSHARSRAGWLSAVCLTVALAAAAALPAAAQDARPSFAPDNPAFVDYLRGGPTVNSQSLGDRAPGLVPSPLNLPTLKGRLSVRATVTLPTTYDLRATNKLTPIRDQGSCGSCWTFGSMGSLESSLMPGESLNFSENGLKNWSGFDISCCSGGNRDMAAAYLTRWDGPVNESDDPYNASSCTSPSGLAPQKHVQEIIYLPTRSGSLDNDALKQAVMTYGAVYTTYYHSDAYYRSATAAYYCTSATTANHAVCIVGWDDNYPASNFNTPAPGNGAFLIRNSWGTWWGMSGYFWMSYYDATLGRDENGVFRTGGANYDTIYQYDKLGWVSNTGYGSNTAWFANIFTTTNSSPIVAASWYSASPGSTYTVYVYTNATSGPTSGTLAATRTGTLPNAGYATVELDSPVPITQGQKFSVVVKLTTPGYTYPIPVERPYSGYSSGATASTGQSYMSSTGTSWTDVASSYANTNVCLKAFGGGGSTPPPSNPGALSVTPTTGLASAGNAGGPFSPLSQSYTLTNTGGSAINWTAAKNQSWTTLSAASGSLAAGASATVTVSINSAANTLAQGSYSDTVSFTNTTNSTGNATRAVALTVNAQPTAGVLSISPSSGLSASGSYGGPFSPSTMTYTLTNTGNTSIIWTASKSQTWTSLSAASGTLSAGASTPVTVSINSLANSLGGGSYSDSVVFTNSTNGAGNTTRPVSLTVNAAPPPASGSYKLVSVPMNWIDPTYHRRYAIYGGLYMFMPFSVRFYGQTYSTLYIGANGVLSFSQYGLYSNVNTDIPNTGYPNAGMYPYWDSLNPNAGGGLRVAVLGAAPSRKLVISWVDTPHSSSTYDRFTFQAILTEGSSDILFQYAQLGSWPSPYASGGSATIGVENPAGTEACKYCYNGSVFVPNWTALKFTPVLQSGR